MHNRNMNALFFSANPPAALFVTCIFPFVFLSLCICFGVLSFSIVTNLFGVWHFVNNNSTNFSGISCRKSVIVEYFALLWMHFHTFYIHLSPQPFIRCAVFSFGWEWFLFVCCHIYVCYWRKNLIICAWWLMMKMVFQLFSSLFLLKPKFSFVWRWWFLYDMASTQKSAVYRFDTQIISIK